MTAAVAINIVFCTDFMLAEKMG